MDRQPLLLLVSSTSLLPMLIPAQNVRGLPARLAALVEARLRRCGLDDRTIAAETLAMASVAVGPTVDRSVLGIMVDFAKAADANPLVPQRQVSHIPTELLDPLPEHR